jgi:hypothetical protein
MVAGLVLQPNSGDQQHNDFQVRKTLLRRHAGETWHPDALVTWSWLDTIGTEINTLILTIQQSDARIALNTLASILVAAATTAPPARGADGQTATGLFHQSVCSAAIEYTHRLVGLDSCRPCRRHCCTNIHDGLWQEIAHRGKWSARWTVPGAFQHCERFLTKGVGTDRP